MNARRLVAEVHQRLLVSIATVKIRKYSEKGGSQIG